MAGGDRHPGESVTRSLVPNRRARERERELSARAQELLESTRFYDMDRLDLEVTSNRPDCLGHVGVARERAGEDPPCGGRRARPFRTSRAAQFRPHFRPFSD